VVEPGSHPRAINAGDAMPTRIHKPQRIAPYIGVPIQVLRVGVIGDDAIRADEPPDDGSLILTAAHRRKLALPGCGCLPGVKWVMSVNPIFTLQEASYVT